MKAILYRHPNGEGRIQFDTEHLSLEILNAETGAYAYAAIGPQGLRELTQELFVMLGDEVQP